MKPGMSGPATELGTLKTAKPKPKSAAGTTPGPSSAASAAYWEVRTSAAMVKAAGAVSAASMVTARPSAKAGKAERRAEAAVQAWVAG